MDHFIYCRFSKTFGAMMKLRGQRQKIDKKNLSNDLDKLGLSTRGKTMKEVQEMAAS
jgi:hypothetical protein